MKKYRVLSLLLALCLVCALLPVTAGAAGMVEVGSATEMAQALADTPAQAMRYRSAATETVRVLVLEPVLPDACGAQRVLHYAAYEEYVLEFSSRETAEAAYHTLTGTYGLENCWLDTPEQGAHVMDSGAEALEANSWGARYMNLTAYQNDAHTLAHFNNAQTVVAIIDSGVDPNADNLTARSWQSYDFANNSSELAEVTVECAAKGHGTRVASILDSMLPEHVQFMYLRVFSGATAERVTVLTALQYAVEHGADVVNLSLGWEDDTQQSFTFLDRAMRAANAKGITLVCAAGNDHQDVENCYPANSKYTIAVAAVSQRLRYEVYSNYGALVDFCAPGSGIAASTLGGEIVSCTGTSFAAPHITAAAAELKILEPAATAERIYTLLRTYANDIGVAGKDNIYGWGIPILPESYTDLITHTWDAGHVKSAATAAKDGERVFTCTVCGETRSETISATGETADSGFVDVPRTEYYAVPVAWAAANGITTGTDDTHFSPDWICTRAQVVTFLWRAAGEPKPKTTVNPFTDVKKGEYYYDAVLWAVENGITKGTSNTTFAPDDTCTRAHVVTFLWRFDQSQAGAAAMDATVYVTAYGTKYHKAGCQHLTDSAREITLSNAISQGYEPCADCWNAAGPMEPTTTSGFTDVPGDAYYAEAVGWALKNKITNGMTPTTFEPNTGCTRAHVVTFLYRYVNGVS